MEIQEYLLKVAIVGEARTGKSEVVSRYVHNSFNSNYISTIGVDISLKTLDIQGTQCKVQLWDTAGQIRFQQIADSCMLGSHAVLVVCDVSSQASYSSLPSCIRRVRRAVRSDVIVFVVGNKADEEGRCVTTEEAMDICNQLSVFYMEVSAKTGLNITVLFELIVSRIVAGFKAVRPLRPYMLAC